MQNDEELIMISQLKCDWLLADLDRFDELINDLSYDGYFAIIRALQCMCNMTEVVDNKLTFLCMQHYVIELARYRLSGTWRVTDMTPEEAFYDVKKNVQNMKDLALKSIEEYVAEAGDEAKNGQST